MMNYTIWCDGGCSGNPGDMYGSYLIITENNKYLQRLKFGHGTNNQAEYLALIFSLANLTSLTKYNTAKSFSVCVFSDSQLMVKQINGDWECNNSDLARLKKEAVKLINPFQNFEIIWKPRQEIVKILGH